MNVLLLDTPVLLSWLSDSPLLKDSARKAIADCPAVYVSAITAWELGIKMSAGKLDFDGDFEEQLALNHFLALPVTVAHASAAAKLPPHHDGIFDRMLVAQAIAESMTLATHNARLKTYDARVMLIKVS